MESESITPTSGTHQQTACPVSSSNDTSVIVEIPRAPVNCNSLYETCEAALQALQGKIQLAYSRQSQHIFNQAFDPELMEYNIRYENSQHFSPRFRTYAHDMAAQLIERYQLRGKHIIDVGCGKGEFLTLLADMAEGHGTGFDPSFVPDRVADTDGITYNALTGADPSASSNEVTTFRFGRTTFVRDYYSMRYASTPVDLMCSRHVLEHIPEPNAFLHDLRQIIGNRYHTALFVEVPNAGYMVRNMAIWDIIYEHCSYYSVGSLARVLHTNGFEVQRVNEVFGEQFLAIEALPQVSTTSAETPTWDGAATMDREVVAFAENFQQKVDYWTEALERSVATGKRAVVWGAGSKGVMFLNTMRVPDAVDYIVDINPRKHGMFVAGAGQKIVPADFLREYQPDTVIIMNAIYVDEIRQQLDQIGVKAECVAA
ncbi:MAG: methyltransferase domain-containing protein [Chloroflexi bacterium AL-W]|nr:methyltransferase domain-containing protein [Chloroflexi bacterium AL-N1]NOK65447.1 methyltransferase domain-containing protein [Chloroflexi bacterium AL-N10]NOK72287.1 methyltransferase domain-containing protein [Chloroflexi bacterium AL-N5]NOK79627.1 methyltransferase domain-containing protein [Chloroflexi bacterium AL-W]NOK87542.1 methyltransferase domain-containing protein [Chloroflexi bacterium AL-N15]